jgi:purine-nucleoside phosphorylase
MNELAIQIRESAAFINRKMEAGADLAIILGTGLGSLTDRIEILRELSFKLIPHFVPPTVDSHSGKLILAKWKGHKLWILSGRLHYYEGYTSQEITYPVRVLKELGVQQLWITNAAGTVNPEYTAGDIVFIEDHINFHPYWIWRKRLVKNILFHLGKAFILDYRARVWRHLQNTG